MIPNENDYLEWQAELEERIYDIEIEDIEIIFQEVSK